MTTLTTLTDEELREILQRNQLSPLCATWLWTVLMRFPKARARINQIVSDVLSSFPNFQVVHLV